MDERHNHLLFIALSAGVIAAAVWISLAQLEVVSEAHGVIVPSIKVARLQHLEGGIVDKIHVKEGGEVTKGDEIISLESTATYADVEEIAGLIAGLRIDQIRLEAELTSDQDLIYPSELEEFYPSLVTKSQKRFLVRQTRQSNLIAVQKELVGQRIAENEEIRARLRNNEESLNLLNEQIGISTSLLVEKLTNRMNHLQLLKEKSRLDGRLNEDEAALQRIHHAIMEAKIRIKAVQNNYFEEVRHELDEKTQAYNTLIERQQERRHSLSRTVIRSPVNGIVQSIKFTSVGAVVAPGAIVAVIVPQSSTFLVEANLQWQDIGYVQPGQTVRIGLASNDAYRFGKLDGRVLTISPDTIKDGGQTPHYKIIIEINGSQFGRVGSSYKLVPGVQVVCGLVIGTRSVFNYIFEPFMSNWQHSLSER